MMILQYQISIKREGKMREKSKKNGNQIIMHPGSLKEFGYRLHESPALRRTALRKAAKKYGVPKLKEKLRGLKVLMTNRGNRMVIARDLTYLQGKGKKKREDKASAALTGVLIFVIFIVFVVAAVKMGILDTQYDNTDYDPSQVVKNVRLQVHE